MKRSARADDSYRVEIYKHKDKKLGTAYYASLLLPPNEYAWYETAEQARRHAIKIIKKLAGDSTADIEMHVFDKNGKAIEKPYNRTLVNGKVVNYLKK